MLQTFPTVTSVVMARPRSETTRPQTYRIPVAVLDRIDRFIEAFEAKHGFRMTSVEFVTKSIIESLDRRESEVIPPAPARPRGR